MREAEEVEEQQGVVSFRSHGEVGRDEIPEVATVSKTVGEETDDELDDEAASLLPSSVGAGNLMVATWVIGSTAAWEVLGPALAAAPFDVVVLVLLPSCEEDISLQLLLATKASRPGAQRTEADWPYGLEACSEALCQEKRVIELHGMGVFVCSHKAKVRKMGYQVWLTPAAVAGSSTSSLHGHPNDACIATLGLTLERSRQRLERVRIGIVNFLNHDWPETLVDGLVDSILRQNIAILTGFFGNEKDVVEEIAERTRAILDQPLVQPFWRQPNVKDATGRDFMTWKYQFMPSYLMFYGDYRTASRPGQEEAPVVTDWTDHGEDIEDWLLGWSRLPRWTNNDEGSAHVPNLGNIKQKKVDWDRWLPGVHQLFVWLFTSTPSYKSQKRQELKGKGKKGKKGGKGKGEKEKKHAKGKKDAKGKGGEGKGDKSKK